jgi:hypothetical protein
MVTIGRAERARPINGTALTATTHKETQIWTSEPPRLRTARTSLKDQVLLAENERVAGENAEAPIGGGR